jgi:hypothetical protein
MQISEIVRREIFAEQNKFSGHFDRDSVVDSVPHCLVELVLMIEHGPDIKSQIENGLSHMQKQVLVQHLFQKPLVLCEMVLALGFLTAIYFSDGFC